MTSAAQFPPVRLVFNAAASIVSKAVTGYWHLSDPANGYTAIAAEVLRVLPLDSLDNGYFFETDMLCRLGEKRAVICDLPIPARYRDEKSNANLTRELPRFLRKYCHRFIGRLKRTYFTTPAHPLSYVLAGIAVLLTLAVALAAGAAPVAASGGCALLALLLIAQFIRAERSAIPSEALCASTVLVEIEAPPGGAEPLLDSVAAGPHAPG